jgi:hypothetical protein
MNAAIQVRFRVVVGAPPPRAERLPDDPRIGVVHSMLGGMIRTIVFVPEELRELADE